MTRTEISDVLFAHAIERYTRKRMMGRMQLDAWRASCYACHRVEARTLDILGTWLCETGLTIAEAAWRAGHKLDYREIKALVADAENTVAANLARGEP